MKALFPLLRIQDREKSGPDGLPGRLMSSIIAFVALVPALAYVAYLELHPAIVIALTVILTPLAMFVAQQYLSSLKRLYSSYRSAIVATNDWRPLLGDISVTATVGLLTYIAVRNLVAGPHILGWIPLNSPVKRGDLIAPRRPPEENSQAKSLPA